ncbi:MAG: hypothetical protein GF330_11520, partial [Candidatus Eisenbacteria bacterium]|nr:hypothetical protein [Candidatus Eisenbacteria bacterium]
MRQLHIDLGATWRGGQRQCALLCRRLAAAGVELDLVGRRGGVLLEEMAADRVGLWGLGTPAEG